MDLSIDLVKQFVDATNDSNSSDKTSTRYRATTVVNDEGIFVKIDGSDILTPVSMATDARDGDRVLVSIENHRADIVGNLTSPGSGRGASDLYSEETQEDGTVVVKGELRVAKEYVDTLIAGDITADSIVADRAKIGDLEADNATINGKLTAQEADIQNLKADNVTITGKLEANSAEINTLKANDVTITGKLEAHDASIENLEADNATINGKLTAQEASIESLEADNATINGKLTAQEASIESLEADNATINGKLTAQEAEITNLSGEFASFVSGEFGTLSADVADIQTLMFGSATGTTITSEFANTVVSHIGEAQIDSAMIKDLTFDKITGFDVNTTNLTIHSEDGKSQWYDNTIQISDANRVRVQIGKDASNDYSMYVWDAEGNLMFDALGLTASGIQREIIRNDMVAEDAAINGSKLDIESVFREMDGSTYTLTSNHLTYDGKSLDLTLKSMSETDKEQGQLLSSQGTQITAIQGQIASKIWQQDIDTATGEMNTKYSELEQELDGFKTTVGETYSTKAEAEVLAEAASNAQKAADDAQADLDNAKANLADVTSRVDATEEDIAAAQAAVDEAQTAADNAQKAADNAKSAADKAQSDVNALTKRVETAETSINQNTEQISLRATKSEVTTAKDEAIAKANQALAESKSYTDAQIKVSADGIESTVSSTYATKEALSAAETRITQTEKSINSQVSETNDLKSRMSTVEQTASGLEVRLTNAENDIDGIEIGGRNLLLNSDKKVDNNNYLIAEYTPNTPLIEGETYTVTVCITPAEGVSYLALYFSGGWVRSAVLSPNGTTKQTISKTFVMAYYPGRTPDDNIAHANAQFYRAPNDGTVTSNSVIHWVKIEKGNKATDWTPAPEDVDTGISEAAKTATNFLSYDGTNGLLMGNKTSGSWSGYRSQMLPTAFNVLNESGDILSSFGPTTTIGQTSGQHVLIDSDRFDVKNGSDLLASYGETIKLYNDGKEAFTIKQTEFLKTYIDPNGANNDFYCTITLSTLDAYVNAKIRAKNDSLITTGTTYVVHLYYTDENVDELSKNRYIIFDVGQVDTPLTSFAFQWNPTQPAYVYFEGTQLPCYHADSSAVIDVEINGGLWINNSSDVNGNVYDMPPLAIGSKNGARLEFDCNEIMARGQDAPAHLYLNMEGGVVSVNNNANYGTLFTGNAIKFKCRSWWEDEWRTAISSKYEGDENPDDGVNEGTLVLHIGEGKYLDVWDSDNGDYYDKTVIHGGEIEFLLSALGDTCRFMSNSSNEFVIADTNGSSVLIPKTAGGNVALGYGGYENGTSNTNIYGNDICLKSKSENITTNCRITIEKNGQGIRGLDSSGNIKNMIYIGNTDILNVGGGSNPPAAARLVSTGETLLKTTNAGVKLDDAGGSTYDGYFHPTTDNKVSCGRTSYRWTRVYAANSSISTSDKRQKKNIKPIKEKKYKKVKNNGKTEEVDLYSELFDRLQPCEYEFIEGEQRVNFGLVAQDVLESMAELGIAEDELDLVHHDIETVKESNVEIDSETGEEKLVETEREVESYGLAYENLIALLINEVQNLKAEVFKQK